MIYCIAEFEAKEGRADELFNALKQLEKETRVEQGCIQYIVMRKILNNYAKGDHKGIIFNEIWETEQDFNAHNESNHVQKFFKEQCLNENGSTLSWNVNCFS